MHPIIYSARNLSLCKSKGKIKLHPYLIFDEVYIPHFNTQMIVLLLRASYPIDNQRVKRFSS